MANIKANIKRKTSSGWDNIFPVTSYNNLTDVPATFTPSSHNHDSLYVPKVTGPTTYSQLYGKSLDGAQLVYNMSADAVAATVALRSSNGVLNVGAPTADGHAATKKYVDDSISALLGSAPDALNTLKEIADALNNDADFAGTMTTELAKKVNAASPAFTGSISLQSTDTKHSATLQYEGTSNVTIKLPSAGGTLVLTSGNITGNAATATKANALASKPTTTKSDSGELSHGSSYVVTDVDIAANGNLTLTRKKLPSDLDVKVTQTLSSSSNTSKRPIIIGSSYSDASTPSFSTTTDTVLASHNIYVSPKDGYLYAAKLYSGSTEVSVSGHTHDQYLTEHQSLKDYATKTWVEGKGYTTLTLGTTATTAATGNHTHNQYLTSHQSLSGYATQTWVEGKGYLTSHQSISHLAPKANPVFTGSVTLPNKSSNKDITNILTVDETGLISSIVTTNDFASASHTHNYLPLSGGILTGSVQYKTTNYTSTPISVYDDNTSYGHTLVIEAGGTTYVGGGESASSLRNTIGVNGTENLYLTADNNVYLYSNCQTIANRIGISFDTSGNMSPTVTKTASLGTSSLYWNNIYGTTIYENGSSLSSLYAASSHTHAQYLTASDITGKQDKITSSNKLAYSLISGTPTIPTTLPASDVYSWAKASTKPSYGADEISTKDGTVQSDITGIKNLLVSNDTDLDTVQEIVTYIKANKTDIASITSSKQDKITSSNKLAYSLISGTPTIPTTLPASDVYSWAKASAKPSYTYSEITGANGLGEGTSDVTDNTEILTSYASNNGFADTNATGVVYRRDAVKVYNYIKGKLDSVYQAKGSYSASTHNHDSSYLAKDADRLVSASVSGSTLTLTDQGGSQVTFTKTTNTDSNVNQSATTTANYRPIILGAMNNGTAGADALQSNTTSTVYATKYIYAQPSTGSLYATKLYSGGKEVLTSHQSLSSYATQTWVTGKGYLTSASIGGAATCDVADNNAADDSEQTKLVPLGLMRQVLGGYSTTGHTHSQYLTTHQSVSSSNNTASWGSAVTVGTVGGTELKFTMPSNPNTNTWRPVGTGATDAAAGNHTHTASLATDTGTSAITLAYGGKYKLTAGGNSVIFTMPASDNTNTWRGIQNNLTSDSTTDSLSAAQGKALKGLIDGKQATITSTNKLAYSLLSGTPTIPTTLPANGGTSTATAYVNIVDVRDGTRAPNYFGDKRMKPWFNSSGTPSSDWYSGIHMTGWTVADYYSWELASGSTTSTNADSTGRLWYRTGKGTTWGDWTKIAWTSDIPTSLPASDVYSWAKASTKPSYSFSGTAATSSANSGTAVSAAPSGHTHSVTATGTVSLGSNTTATNGIAYVEPSVSGTTLTLTVKYFHPSFTGTAATSAANSGTAVSAAPSGHTHSVTATGSVS